MGTIGFGSPPVYTANPLPVLSNVFLVKNDDDGLSGGSLRTIMDIMLKLRAIDSLNYRKRDLLKMILDDSDDEESEEDSEESWMALDSMTAPESMTFPDDVEIIGFINKTDILIISRKMLKKKNMESSECSMWRNQLGMRWSRQWHPSPPHTPSPISNT